VGLSGNVFRNRLSGFFGSPEIPYFYKEAEAAGKATVRVSAAVMPHAMKKESYKKFIYKETEKLREEYKGSGKTFRLALFPDAPNADPILDELK
jgi:hypothetical protein